MSYMLLLCYSFSEITLKTFLTTPRSIANFLNFSLILEESSISNFISFPVKISQKRVNLSSIICTDMMKPLLITTQQSKGTHWEAGVLGGEKQSRNTTYNLEGDIGKQGFGWRYSV